MAAFLMLTCRRNISNATGAEQLRALQKTGLLRLTDLKNDPAKFFEAWLARASSEVFLILLVKLVCCSCCFTPLDR